MKAVNDRELRINDGDVTCTLDVSIKEKDVSWKLVPSTFFTARASDGESIDWIVPDTTSLRPTVSTTPIALVTRNKQLDCIQYIRQYFVLWILCILKA